jgi:hypothetical protein
MRLEDAVEHRIEDKTRELIGALRRVGQNLAAGNNQELLVWVIADELACAPRPLRFHPQFGKEVLERNELYGRPDLPPEAAPEVFKWIERMKIGYDIHSIISLMHPSELRRYRQLDLGADDLIDLYRKSFGVDRVRQIPWNDPAQRSLDNWTYQKELARVREEALSAFDQLRNYRPILLHCSAGVQRSAPVAAYIWAKRSATQTSTQAEESM